MGNPSKQTPAARTRSVEIAEKAARAVQLRHDGLSYSAIASALGISQTRAYELVTESLRAQVATPAQAFRDARIKEIEKVIEFARSVLEAHQPLVQGGRAVMQELTDPVTGEVLNSPTTGKPFMVPVSDKGPALKAAQLLLNANAAMRDLVGGDAPKVEAIDLKLAGVAGAAIALDPRGLAEIRQILESQREKDMGAVIEVIPRAPATENGDRNATMQGESNG